MMGRNGYSNGNYERHKVFSYFSVIVFALLILAVEYAFYLAFIPRTIFSYVQQPFTVLEDSVFEGQEVHILRESCRVKSTPTSANIYFKSGDSLVYIMSREVYTPTRMGCTSETMTYKIPSDLPPGRWKIIFDMTFKVTPLRVEHRRYESEEFEVLAPTTKTLTQTAHSNSIHVEPGTKLELHVTKSNGETIVIPIETPDR